MNADAFARSSARRRSRAGLLLAVVVLSATDPLPVASGDPTPRERYWRDGDARALAAALGTSREPADLEDAALARRAAEPQAPGQAGPDDTPLVRAVDALRRADLDGARAALPDAVPSVPSVDVRASMLDALLAARRGQDDDASRRLISGPIPVQSRDGARLAVLGAALTEDDRELLAGLLRSTLAKAGEAGRADVVAGLAEAAAALDAESGARALVAGARILRRGGRPADALALLDGAAAARCGAGSADLRLERAILAWRRNDAATARTESSVAAADVGSFPWAFAALARAGPCGAVVPAPPLTASEGSHDADAFALARLLTTIGIAVRPEDVATRAAAQSTNSGDPAFVRRWLDSLEVARLETAGEPADVEAALAKGLPVLVYRPGRDGEKFTDRPVVVRGHDAITGLLIVDETDPRRLDLMPLSWIRKSRALIVAPRARAPELVAWRDGVGARRGALVFDALALLFGPTPESAAAALRARAPEFAGDVTLEAYLGYATYAPAFLARDAARLAEAAAVLRRSSSNPPVTTLERLMRAEGALGGDVDVALVELTEAARTEGEAPWIELTRFVVLESARRHAEALEALERARALDPLDVRTLYFRSGTRRLLGDGPGGRADLVRVLERRPDHVPAADDLASSYVDDGAPERALAVVKALVAADPDIASSRRVRQLRQRVEVRLVRKARSAADLLPLAASPEPDVRAEVARTASSFETDDAEALLRAFLADADETVRRRAASAYQRPSLGDRAARDGVLLAVLVARLVADPAPAVREALARALARVRSATATNALSARVAGAQADPAVGVRATIADLLSSSDGDGVRRALVLALSDVEMVVRAAAIGSLRRLTGASHGFEPDDPPERRAAAIAEWNRRLAMGR